MIRLTRLNGSVFSLNPDLIHRAEETPDTVLMLIDGSRYVVVEPLEEIITRVVGYRARVVAAAGRYADEDEIVPLHALPPLGDGTDDDGEGADIVSLRSRRA